MYHFRKTRKKYIKANIKDRHPSAVCTFCDPKTLKNALSETKYSYIVANRVFYDLWEMNEVIDHLLLIPKRHVESLAKLNAQEKVDAITIMGEYEAKGYNVYARGTASIMRSVSDHQHTHLIKIRNGKKARFTIFSLKPYFLWRW